MLQFLKANLFFCVLLAFITHVVDLLKTWATINLVWKLFRFTEHKQIWKLLRSIIKPVIPKFVEHGILCFSR